MGSPLDCQGGHGWGRGNAMMVMGQEREGRTSREGDSEGLTWTIGGGGTIPQGVEPGAGHLARP